MKKQFTGTIRLGAAHWDATFIIGGKPVHFDFRKMTVPQRKQWYGAFMASTRKVFRKTPEFASRGEERRHRRARRYEVAKRQPA